MDNNDITRLKKIMHLVRGHSLILEGVLGGAIPLDDALDSAAVLLEAEQVRMKAAHDN